jgi:hypothetical protein
MTSVNVPVNHRAKWTETETKQLIKEIKKNMSIEKIANIHKRTINAIKYKLIRYAIDMADEDQSLNLSDISQYTGLSIEDIKEGFDKLHYDYSYMEENTDIDTNSDTSSDNSVSSYDTFTNDINLNEINSNINEINNNINCLNTKINIITITLSSCSIIYLSLQLYQYLYKNNH